MAKKKDGPARPVRWSVTIEGGTKGDLKSYQGDYQEAVEKAEKHLGHLPMMVRIHTSRRRSMVQSGRMTRYSRSVGWVFQRTFIFE